MNLRQRLLVLFSFLAPALAAQVNGVSPYSRYGVGDPGTQESVQSIGMGGIGTAVRDQTQLNLQNPAAITSLNLTSIEIAFNHTEINQQTSATPSVRNNITGFSYLTLAVPAGDHFAFALGAKPYSSIGYNIINEETAQPGIGTVTYQFSGEGGLNQAFGMFGFEFKGLSIGAEASFLFGNLVERQTVFFDSAGFFDVQNVQEDRLRGVQFNLGAQYEARLKNNVVMSVGATYRPQVNLGVTRNQYAYTLDIANNTNPYKDTILFVENQEGTYSLAPEWTAGVVFGKKSPEHFTYAWKVGFDYRAADWTAFRDIGGSTETLKKAFRMSFGASIVPKLAFTKLDRSRNYLTDIQYRVGAYYEDTPLNLRNTPILNYGMTFGVGFPIVHKQMIPGEEKMTMLNFGVAFGRRGTTDNGLIQENYARILFGITLSDRWFIKYKYR